jgi:prephenate dehydrogenase
MTILAQTPPAAQLEALPPAVPAVEPPSAAVPAEAPKAGLARVRGEIEQVDRQMVELIARRVDLARQVGPLKQALGMPILDPPREAAIVRRAGEIAREAGLDDDAVRYIFWHLVGMSRRVQLEGE